MMRAGIVAACLVLTTPSFGQDAAKCRELAGITAAMARTTDQLARAMRMIVDAKTFTPTPDNKAAMDDFMAKTKALADALDAYTESARTWRNHMEACG